MAILLDLPASSRPAAAQTVHNVKDYGATGNGTSLDTVAIQAAVNAAHGGGAGVVFFPAGTYKMTGITLTNNITISLTNHAVLIASTNQNDWASPAVNKIFYASHAHDIAITGPGLIDGGGLFFYQGDPGNPINGNHLTHMLEFHFCKNVTLAGLHLQNSCEQTITFNDCSNVTVTSVTVTNRPREFGSGDDGIDFSDCGYVVASNLDITTGDDGICVKTETGGAAAHDIFIENCTVASTCQATKIGTATYAPVYNLTFTNITINRHPGIVIGANNPLPDGRCEAAIAFELCDGGFNHDIVCRHYTINDCSIPIYVEVNDRIGAGFGGQSNLFFGDINCLNASNACQINVQAGATNNLTELVFSNLTVHNYETTYTTNSPPFQDNGYPYGYQIGGKNVHLPAYGLFARYVNGLHFEGNDQFFDDGRSGRPNAVVLENVTNASTISQTNNAGPPVFDSITAEGANLQFSGSGGTAGSVFYVAATADLALPVANWTVISTNTFDASGNFNFTNAMNTSSALQFFALLLVLPAAAVAAQPSADTEVVAMLQNIRDHGSETLSNVNHGLGGLWVNWRYGTSPLLVNFNGSGHPDAVTDKPPRHDELTDMRYLHNLWWYKKLHPADRQFDGDLARYTAIVKREFTTNIVNQRGWMYDEELMPLWQLSGDDFYRQAAFHQAGYFANTLYRPGIGAYYNTSSSAPGGYYRVDWQLEIGCALIQAGTQFTNADWVMKGSNMVEFAYAHAYLVNFHHFLQDMSNVVDPDGTAVPNENVYVTHGTDGGAVRMSPLGQEALSLLHVYLVTSNRLYLNRALDLLGPETVEKNSFGLWDTNYGGYYGGLEFSGPTFQNPGMPTIITRKEGGRQMDLLEAFHLANAVGTNCYAATEAALKTVLLNKTYYAPGRGILYEVNADWSVRTVNGLPENWVTTEAMGIVLEALFSLEDSQL